MGKNANVVLILAALLVFGCNEDSGGDKTTNPEEPGEQLQPCDVEGQVRCGGVCIDPNVSLYYCGADEMCRNFAQCDASTQECSEGKCVAKKDTPPQKDPGTQKDPDEKPVSCENGEHPFNETCEPDSVDHCGEHDKSCLMVEGWAEGTCESGQCKVQLCQSGMHVNGDICEFDNVAHCGSVDRDCANDIVGWIAGICESGLCKVQQCQSGMHMMNNSCEADSIEHCGSAENSCANAVEGWLEGVCEAGACVVTSCKDGYHVTESKTCEQDMPACELEGQVKCGDVCVDPLTSLAFCGADESCEHYTPCGSNQSCVGGKCNNNEIAVSADDPSFATNDGIPNGITLKLWNKSGKDICFSGKLKLYIKKDNPLNGWATDGSATTHELECHFSAPTYVGDGWPHWYENRIQLAAGESIEYNFTEFIEYIGNGSTVQTTKIPLETYVNNNWYFVSEDNPSFVGSGGGGGVPAIKLGHAAKKDDGSRGDNPFLIHVRPVKASDGKLEKGKKYNLVIYEAVTDSQYWFCD